jgi:hypothetical protein
MSDEKKFLKDICSAVGHDSEEIWRPCKRCGEGDIQAYLIAGLDQYVGSKITPQLLEQMTLTTRLLLNKGIELGMIESFKGLAGIANYPRITIDAQVQKDGRTFYINLSI